MGRSCMRQADAETMACLHDKRRITDPHGALLPQAVPLSRIRAMQPYALNKAGESRMPVAGLTWLGSHTDSRPTLATPGEGLNPKPSTLNPKRFC